MDIQDSSFFISMLVKLAPLYATMGAGFVLGKHTEKLANGLATIQIYLLFPIIVFLSTLKLQIDSHILILPFILFGLCALIGGTSKALGDQFNVAHAPLLGQAAGAMNSGYLGIPIAMILFPSEWIAPYIFISIGATLQDVTLGYYRIARGRFSVRNSLQSVLRLPSIYAIMAGLIGNFFGFSLPAVWKNVEADFMGAYVVLGALIIGAALTQNKKIALTKKVLPTLLCIKFLVWPLLTYGLIEGLRAISFGLPIYGEKIFLLLSILPLAANSAAYASLLDVYPEEAAVTVAISTLLSLVIIPFYVVLFGLGTV